MIKLIKSYELSSSQEKQIIEMLRPSWDNPEGLFNLWKQKIETYLFVIKNDEIQAMGSWKIHKIESKGYEIAVSMVLFAVSTKAQGQGLGIQITLLSFINAFKEAIKKYNNNKIIFWGASGNPIVINSYLKHFPLYQTPKLNGEYNNKYVNLAKELKSYIKKDHQNHQHEFLIKNCVPFSYTDKELILQESYIKKIGDEFNIDLNPRSGDRLILILADINTKLDYYKILLIHYYLKIRQIFKNLLN